MRKKILVGAVLLLLIGGGFVAWFFLRQDSNQSFFTTSPEDVATQFVDALSTGNFDKSYSFISDDLKQKMISQDIAESEFLSLEGGQASLLESKASNDGSYSSEQNAHRFIYRFDFDIDKDSGKYYEVQFVLIRLESSWKVDYFKGEYVKDV